MRVLAVLLGLSDLLSKGQCSGLRHRGAPGVELSPANSQKNVNIDTNLVLTFPSPPTIGGKGTVKIYNAADGKQVDVLDLDSVLAQSVRGNGSTKANYSDTTTYQTNIIEGDGFLLLPHHRAREYRQDIPPQQQAGVRTEVLRQDRPGVLNVGGGPFRASTRRAAGPSPQRQVVRRRSSRVTVAADGSADFNTVQGQ